MAEAQTTYLQNRHLESYRAYLAYRSQQTRDIDLMLNQRRATVYDAGPTMATVIRHWIDVSCFLCRLITYMVR